jgi:ubiquitin C-terminal hydrolase
MSSTESLPPLIGLPNIGNSCWLNSIVQMILHSHELTQTIGEKGVFAGPLHAALITLINCIKTNQTERLLDCYKALYHLVVNLNANFIEHSSNDAHEVLTYLVNGLHQESCALIPQEIIERLQDPASITILRDFENKLSPILETVVFVTCRKASDGSEIFESNNTLFIEPLQMQDQTYSVQAALDRLEFASLPKCLFVKIMIQKMCQCRLPNLIQLHDVQYHLKSIIFFISAIRHYITAVKTTYKSVDGWYIFNDTQVTFIPSEQLGRMIQAFPSVILYEK